MQQPELQYLNWAHQHRICTDISGCLTSKFEQHQNQIQIWKQCLCSSQRDILFVQSSFKDLGCDGSYTTTFLKNSQINQILHCSNLNYNLSTDPPTQNMHRHFWVQLTSNSNSTRIRSPSLQKMSLQQLQRHSVCAMKFQGSGL